MRAPKATDLAFDDSAGGRWRAEPTTLVDLLLGFVLLALAISLGGSAAAFIDIPSLLIVVGGTISAVAICFSVREVIAAAEALRNAVGGVAIRPREFALQLLALADHARQSGILALENLPHPIAGSEFLDKALALSVDGTPEAEIAASLRRDAQAASTGRLNSADVLRKAAEIAPAMGLIGTLVGLVQMLRHLDQPSEIGPGMAVALLTTFYGAVIGHMVFAPLAAKIERQAAAANLIHDLSILTALSVARRENPRHLEAALNGVLPTSERVQVFD